MVVSISIIGGFILTWVCAGRKKFVVVPAGTRLEIIGISTRRIESGKWYYFECRYETGGEKVLFDYPISKRYLKLLHFEFK